MCNLDQPVSLLGTFRKYFCPRLLAEHTETAKNFDLVFELLQDCGKAYKLANEYQKRCFNQALFKKILVYEELAVEADYVEPFDALLSPAMFELKREFEKSIREKRAGQPESAALLSFLETIPTKTAKTIRNFFSVGLSKSSLVRERRLELPRHLTHAPQTCLSTCSSTRANLLIRHNRGQG